MFSVAEAKKEEEAYDKYKQAKKPTAVSYVGTVGTNCRLERTFILRQLQS